MKTCKLFKLQIEKYILIKNMFSYVSLLLVIEIKCLSHFILKKLDSFMGLFFFFFLCLCFFLSESLVEEEDEVEEEEEEE